MFLLDTNVVSELRKFGDGKADVNVIAWVARVDAATLYLSAMTLMEIELSVLPIESMLPWRFAVRPCMCLIHGRSVMPSLRRRPWCMA